MTAKRVKKQPPSPDVPATRRRGNPAGALLIAAGLFVYYWWMFHGGSFQ